MKNWWRKWSYEIPLALGDALWEVLVVQFADFLDRLTVRRVLEFVAIAIFVMAFAQTFPIDLAILFAGDTLMYLEILVAIRIAAGRELFQEMLRLTVRVARLARGTVHPTTHSLTRSSDGCEEDSFPYRRFCRGL